MRKSSYTLRSTKRLSVRVVLLLEKQYIYTPDAATEDKALEARGVGETGRILVLLKINDCIII